MKTDRYDYGARFYDPELGRFTTPDPHTESYLDFSPYQYVLNNPLNATDPDGMDVSAIAGGTRYTGIDAQNAFRQLQSSSSSNNPEDPPKKDESNPKVNINIDIQEEDPTNPAGKVLMAGVAVAGILAADDITGIGIADDILIPPVLLTAAALAGLTYIGHEILQFATSPNERHGDLGAIEKAGRQLADLENQLADAKTKKEKQRISQKIKNVKKHARKNKKGEEHSRTKKR